MHHATANWNRSSDIGWSSTLSLFFQCRVGDLLGTGEFGLVYKGVLDSGADGEVEVAVKTLKEGSRGENRVKFLQEAAIMAQFKHHHVITIYGIVKSGEPVSLSLNLQRNKALWSFHSVF